MNRNTLVTLIATVITYALVCISILSGKEIEADSETVTAIATLVAAGIMYAVNHYWNNDYSVIAKKTTPVMRKLKRLEEAGDMRLLDQIEQLITEWEDEEEDEKDDDN